MKSRWVSHKGKRIFIADFSNNGINAAAIRTECAAIITELGHELPGSVRSLTNAEGTFSTVEIMKALSELLPYSNKYIRRRAVVGVGGFRKYFLDAFSNLTGHAHFMAFDTLPQALDWLAED
jgi:hypothetical protein